MIAENVTQETQLASPTVSACCLAPTRLWAHHREEKAGVSTSFKAIVVCGKCRGPADGSRPEQWAFPWHLIQTAEREEARGE